jgi:hypothetical protein
MGAQAIDGEPFGMMRVRRFVAALVLAAIAALACAAFSLHAVIAAPTGGPDFRIDNRDLSAPLRIVVYGPLYRSPRDRRYQSQGAPLACG